MSTSYTDTGNDSNQQQHETPFNTRNVLLDRDAIEGLLRRHNPALGGVKDLNLYRKAMTHRSYCTRKNENFVEGNQNCPAGCIPLQEESNERLEFLGDAVLNLVVAGYLFERFPDDNEGFLTKMRTKLVNGGMLAELCGMCGLDEWVIISRQIDEAGGRRNKKVLEDTFEAFLGAVYIDHGFEGVQSWIVDFVETSIDFTELIKQQTNFKDSLSKYFQHTFNCLPRYTEVDTGSVPDSSNRDSVCTVCVRNKDGVVVATGRGANRKTAENEAARRALAFYGQH
jgi:ribonuclease III